MSLEELNGPILHLVLSLKEGHGFGFLQTQMIVVASTSGLCLETEPIEPCADPIICTDLAWETDKKSLRGFRTSNTPVKVECYSVVNDVKRDRVGYVLLNIKSAQVVPTGKSTKSLEKCHRLMSIPQEAKLLKPELLLSLKIMEANAPESTFAGSSSTLHEAAPESLAPKDSAPERPQSASANARPPTLALPLSHQVPLLPIYSPEENFVQIGLEEKSSNIFREVTCEIENEYVSILGPFFQLVPKPTGRGVDPSPSFHMTCTLFNHTLRTKPMMADSACLNGSGDVRLFQECLKITLFSSVPSLFRYFVENPSATIQLYCNGREIGVSELFLQPLLRTDDRTTFARNFPSVCTKSQLQLSQRCNWISTSTASVPAAPCGEKPFVDVSLRLEVAPNLLSDSSDVKTGETQESLKPLSERHEKGHSMAQSRAALSRNDPQYSGRSSLASSDLEERISFIVPPDEILSPTETVSPARVTASPMTNKVSTEHKYCLRVFLMSATFEKLPPCDRLRFKFEQPSGQVLTSSITDVVNAKQGECTLLADISATLVVRASPSALVTAAVLVTAVAIQDAPPQATPFATASFPISCVCLPGNEPVESAVTGVLRQVASGAHIGTIAAHLSLEHSGHPHHLPASHSFTKTGSTFSDVASSRANASEMYQAVVELKERKERRQEIFEAELKQKQKEASLLEGERANELWLQRRRLMEEKLAEDMAQCRTLAKALSSARDDLCQCSQRCLQKEGELRLVREDLERQYNIKFEQLSLAAKRLDEGVKMKVMLTEAKYSELEDKAKCLVTENEKLRRDLQKEKELTKKLIENSARVQEKTCGLTQNQVEKLLVQVKELEEKLEASIKSKAYLKEEWSRAVREMSISRFGQIGSSFEASEETLSPLAGKGLEQILLQEEEELRQDSKALELLRRQIGDAWRRKTDV